MVACAEMLDGKERSRRDGIRWKGGWSAAPAPTWCGVSLPWTGRTPRPVGQSASSQDTGLPVTDMADMWPTNSGYTNWTRQLYQILLSVLIRILFVSVGQVAYVFFFYWHVCLLNILLILPDCLLKLKKLWNTVKTTYWISLLHLCGGMLIAGEAVGRHLPALIHNLPLKIWFLLRIDTGFQWSLK